MQHHPSKLEIVEETATLSKRDVVTGKVRVSTRTEDVNELVTANLRTEDLHVERVRINREVAQTPAIRTEGDVTIIPIVEEVLVVEKRLVLTEELHIRRTVSQETIETHIGVRKQHAVVERVDVADHSTDEDN